MIFPEISKPNHIKNIGAIEIRGSVCAAHKSGNSAECKGLHTWNPTPRRIPKNIASRNPITVSCEVTIVAGISVGHVSFVASAIASGDGIRFSDSL